jgi:hypothetical protein
MAFDYPTVNVADRLRCALATAPTAHNMASEEERCGL